jgi:nucleotide-binding universal stress UspA family protein
MIRPLVVGVDGSPCSCEAVRWAAGEARRRDLPLHIVHAWLSPLVETSVVPVLGFRSGTTLQTEANNVVIEAAALAAAAAPDVAVETSLVPGDAGAALIEASGDADLLVVGHQGTGGFAGLLAGSVAVAAVSHAACPVVVVRGRQDTGASHVLVGVDGSRSSRRTVDTAFATAWRSSVGVVAMHAYRVTSPHRGFAERVAATSGTVTAFRDHLVAAEEDAKFLVEQQVAAACQRYPEVPVEILALEGPPAEALVGASAGASVVVVGRHGSGRFAALRTGSVIHSLVHHAHCPVLVDR